MYNELLSVRSIPGVLSPRLLVCSISLPRTTSLQQLHPLHWALVSRTSPRHLSMINRGSTLCTFLLYIICGIFLWIVNLSDLSWHQSLHKLALVLSPATCHPTSNFLDTGTRFSIILDSWRFPVHFALWLLLRVRRRATPLHSSCSLRSQLKPFF